MRRIITDYLIGLTIGVLMAMAPYMGIETMGEGVAMLPVNLSERMHESLWVLALVCGVFALGVALICLRSIPTIAIPIVIGLASLLYYDVSNPTLRLVCNGILWGASILLIPFGLIPAWIIRQFLPELSLVPMVLISGVCGYALGILFRYLQYQDMPWDALWFERPTSYSPLRKLTSRLRARSISRKYKKHPVSYSGSGSYSASYSSYSDSSSSSGRTYSESYNQYGEDTGYSKSDGFGGEDYYNQYGERIGYSKEDGFGGHDFYNQYGERSGYSKPDGLGGYDYYNQYGERTGYSKPDGLGGFDHYNEYGEYEGHSKSTDY